MHERLDGHSELVETRESAGATGHPLDRPFHQGVRMADRPLGGRNCVLEGFAEVAFSGDAGERLLHRVSVRLLAGLCYSRRQRGHARYLQELSSILLDAYSWRPT